MRSNQWEDVLGNPGGGYTALDALHDIGCSLDSTVGEVADAIQKFSREVFSDPTDHVDEDQAKAVARDLLRDAEGC